MSPSGILSFLPFPDPTAEQRRAIDERSEEISEIHARVHHGFSSVVRDFLKGFQSEDFDASIAIGRSHKGNRMFNQEVRKHLFGPAFHAHTPAGSKNRWQLSNYQ